MLDTRRADATAQVAGAALLAWIVTEMVLLRTVHLLQVAYLLAGLVITYEAMRRRAVHLAGPDERRAAPPSPSAASEQPATRR